ncbi:MAG TPA: hypothetical protein VIC25_04225 [Caulobacteraceae bacterium]|jgi:hypothetical protein
MTDKRDTKPEWGEGDYAAARRFDAAQDAFAKSGKVEGKAKQAREALDGPEGPALEKARRVSAKGRPESR